MFEDSLLDLFWDSLGQGQQLVFVGLQGRSNLADQVFAWVVAKVKPLILYLADVGNREE